MSPLPYAIRFSVKQESLSHPFIAVGRAYEAVRMIEELGKVFAMATAGNFSR